MPMYLHNLVQRRRYVIRHLGDMRDGEAELGAKSGKWYMGEKRVVEGTYWADFDGEYS